jgi:hypothetical protein
MTQAKRFPSRLTAPTLAMILALAWGSPQAHAQFCMGFGIGGFNYVPSPTDFINQHSLLNASRARGPVSNNVYASNPNAFINRVRDNGFVSHSELRRYPPVTRPQRGVAASTAARTATQPAVAATTPEPAAAPAPKPALPLASFFDAAFRLVWPAEAPVDGELKDKRDVSDQASLAVLDETRRYQAASLSTVTQARAKLLEYGRPALQEIRATATPRIADTFHLFLLSLYESLAQSAYAPQGAPGNP